MEKFHLSSRQDNDVVVVSLFGYLENVGGNELKTFFEKSLEEGVRRFVLDFQGAELISSPGVAALLDVGNRAVDDFDSRIACFGLDQHHGAVLEMSGFFFLVNQAQDEVSALALARE